MTFPPVLGRVEISKLLGVDTRTPHTWHSRGLMPPPDVESVNGGPAWFSDTVIKWAVTTGRCPADVQAAWDPEGHFAAPATRGGRKMKELYS